MKVLLDECLPKQLKYELENYDIKTVPEMDWSGKTNGELLRLAEEKFDIFVTVDQNLKYQQNLKHAKIAIVLIVIPNNQYETFRHILPKLRQALRSAKPNSLVIVKP